MKPLAILSAAAALSVGMSMAALAANKEVPAGKYEYDTSCAVCHGPTGKGDGPFASFLKARPPDLTTLSQRNKGVYPFDYVQKVIDGRQTVKGHGTEEMPIWGATYRAEAFKERGEFYGHFYAEDVVRARILALVSYIHQLQK